VDGKAEIERATHGRAHVVQAGDVAQLTAGEATLLQRPELGRTDVRLGGQGEGLVGPGHGLLKVSRSKLAEGQLRVGIGPLDARRKWA
jgi:hypothetical protein